MAAFFTLRGFGWCFSMCFPNFWLDVYILSQSLQSNFPMSILWVRLCCVRYLFCVNIFPHVSQLNIITAGFLIFTMSPPQFNWCFCKLSFRVYTFLHFSHSNLLSMWVFMCLASLPFATPLSQTLHFSIVWTFPMCFFKIYAVWNFLSQMLQFDSFFGGILCSVCWNKVDCWILFHNQHIDFECSSLKVRVTTEEFDNIQNSEYFQFLTDSNPPSYPNSVRYFLLF